MHASGSGRKWCIDMHRVMSRLIDFSRQEVRHSRIVRVGWSRLLLQDQDAVDDGVSIAAAAHDAVFDQLGARCQHPLDDKR